MSGLIESAAAVMGASERRIDVVSRNVTNMATAGYKKRVAYVDTTVLGRTSQVQQSALQTRTDFKQGKLISTGNPLDLAIEGSGLFKLRDGDRMLYSRQGNFKRDESGAMVSPQGYVLQQAGGGDLVLDNATVSIASDGTVTDQGRPIARVGLYTADPTQLVAAGDAHFTAPDSAVKEAEGATVRSAMVEGSNVDLGDEMVSMMAAVRDSERGARLVQTYDDLLGQAITTLGQAR